MGPQGRSGRRKISPPTGIRSPDRPACSQSLYRLSYPARSISKYMGQRALYVREVTYWHVRVTIVAIEIQHCVFRVLLSFMALSVVLKC